MEKAVCPYCHAPYEVKDGSCAHCQAVFPWESIGERLSDEIKSREPSRARATVTLIDEIFQAANGKGKWPLAAAKGFAFAWLFPRTVIVIGSIVSGLVLMLQTGILYQQTQLIRYQSDASRVENSARLRERIGINGVLVSNLESVHRSLGSLEIVREPCDSNFTPCSENAGEEIERGQRFQSAVGKKDAKESRYNALMSLLNLARVSNESMYEKKYLSDRASKEDSSPETVIDKAVLHCMYPTEKSDRVKRALQLLKQLGKPPSYWEEGTLVKGLVLAQQLVEFSLETRGTQPAIADINKISVEDFLKAYGVWKMLLDDEITAMNKLCSERINRDFSELRKVEVEN